MDKKQKTLSMLLGVALCAGQAVQAHANTTGYPVLTQVPSATIAPAEVPVITQVPLQKPEVPAVPDFTEEPFHSPVPDNTPSVTPQPTSTPVKTKAPVLTTTATPLPAPTAIATATPEAVQKPATATPRPSTDDDYTTGYVGTQEEIAFLLLNQDRAANGLSPLRLDPTLCSLARRKSQDMKDNHYFSHTSPTYGSAKDMLKAFGYSFNAVSENIAHHATIEKSQAAFMSSAGHRKNILSASWTKVGIGVVQDAQGFVYVTQLFVR